MSLSYFSIRRLSGHRSPGHPAARIALPGSRPFRIRETCHRGFTLWELLAVLTLTVALAALLLPTVAAVRSRARDAACLSNLRLIGRAMQQYAQDTDQALPPAWSDCAPDGSVTFLTWHVLLGPYVADPVVPDYRDAEGWADAGGDRWHCPSDTLGDNVSYGTNPMITGVAQTDCTSRAHLGLWQATHTLAQVRHPERVFFAGDTNKEWRAVRYTSVFADWERPFDGPLKGKSLMGQVDWYRRFLRSDYTDTAGRCPEPGVFGCKGPAYRHGRVGRGTGSAGMVFCDGHAASVPFGRLGVENVFPQL